MNEIKMDTRDAILGLFRQGWSRRRIARELGVHRKTVARHINLADKESNCPTNPTPGSDRPTEAEFEGPVAASHGGCGPPSKCEPFREVILTKLDAGLTAQRIWQDLVGEHGFEASYQSVKRFCRRLCKKTPLPFRRIETEPGSEAQVDFGKGAPVERPGRKRRRPHVLRVVLSFSRKGYGQAIWKQTTDEFLGALENSFWYFGGVPKTIVIDNLKAAVTKADWFDPELNPKIEVFCRHYGCVILPTKPYTPRHKGKIEKGIDYVQSNALKGREFKTLEDENRHLLDWETNTADPRIHGTTRKQVGKLFEETERGALLPLPDERFPFFHEGERIVQRDGHVEVDKSYYSVPPEYLGRRVWVRWDTRLVRVLNQRFDEIAVHAKKHPGSFSTSPAHVPPEKISGVERGATHLLKRATLIGPDASRWAEAVIKSRGIPGMRTIQGLLALARKHTSTKIDRACKTALGFGAMRLKDVRALINSDEEQTEFEFMAEHPVIRNMNEYGRIVRVSFRDGKADVVPISAAPNAGPLRGETGAGGGSFLNEERGQS
jgi:transposase